MSKITKEYRKAYYYRNKEHILRLAHDRNRSNPVVQLVTDAKKRAKRSGITFDITATDLSLPSTCPVFGMPLIANVGGKKHSACSPSIDRIDPTKGYVRGNVWIISHRANQIKNDATLAELFRVAEAVATRMAQSLGNS